jgi:hypothetical protein
VFSGAFAMVGCNFFRDVPVPGQKNRVWPGFWANPDLKTVARARANSRIVLLTGTTDFNHESTRAMYDEFVKDKWAYVTYLDVPGMGHEFPDADWFEKGIVALDTPLAALAQARYDAAVEAEKKRKLGEACLGFESAARHGKDKPFVPDARSRGAAVRKKYQQQLASIEKLIEAKQFDRAAPAIRQLKQDYSPLSDETADELLERIKQLRKPATRAAEPS